jgi:hypothetical protein
MQVRILYDRQPAGDGSEIGEFALDLSSRTQPYQLIVAKVGRAATLETIIQDVDSKIAAHRIVVPFLLPQVTLRVPNIVFRLTRQFADLEGIRVIDAGPIGRAWQMIDFKLDRFGAEVKSGAGIGVLGIVKGSYVFDRPFLVVMKKRGNKNPFFAMWIDNAELLSKCQNENSIGL